LEVFQLKAGLTNISLPTFFDRIVDNKTRRQQRTGASWILGNISSQKGLSTDGTNWLKTMSINRVSMDLRKHSKEDEKSRWTSS